MTSLTEKMKAWKTEEFAGIEGTYIASMRIPLILKPSQVLIKVSAASVNPLDTAVLGNLKIKLHLKNFGSLKVFC